MTDLDRAHASLVSALHALRNPDRGWPYYRGRKSRLEPTCWAMLALGESIEQTPVPSWVQDDGLLVEPSTGQINYVFNALSALAASAAGAAPPPLARRVVSALLDARGEVVAQSPVIRQDMTLQAWSWTPGTFTWIEPTSWCMLAVKRLSGGTDVARGRIDLAERVMRDRECPGGGWNFGNGEVYGKGLPAHVPPTALGILAMQDHASDALVVNALRFLEAHAPIEGSTTALALAALAVTTTGRSADSLVAQLAEHGPAAVAFGNVAPIAMAAYALGCARRGERPAAFALAREHTA